MSTQSNPPAGFIRRGPGRPRKDGQLPRGARLEPIVSSKIDEAVRAAQARGPPEPFLRPIVRSEPQKELLKLPTGTSSLHPSWAELDQVYRSLIALHKRHVTDNSEFVWDEIVGDLHLTRRQTWKVIEKIVEDLHAEL